jgi:hypothetical protein
MYVLRGNDGTDDQSDRNGRGKYAHRVAEGAREHEDDRRESARPEAEASLQQRVRRDQFALK